MSAGNDKGMCCEIPNLDPFSAEATQFDEFVPPLDCDAIMGLDWIRCHLSECRIRKYIEDNYRDVKCIYRDIIYANDWKYFFGDPVKVIGNDTYVLERSDHVKVQCYGRKKTELRPLGNPISSWTGHLAGLRKRMRKPSPPGREDTINVLIFAFDTTSRSNFIRRMSKSYKMLKETMGAFISEGFNIIGDGTRATMIPLMTGKTELELPDVRQGISNLNVDVYPMIWYKLRDDGYSTAYYEDLPYIGTFQLKHNGFREQPSDHSLRPLLMEKTLNSHNQLNNSKFCVGDTPTFKLLMNITKDFHTLPGKIFSLTFVGDITHDDINMISLADDDFLEFLDHYWTSGLNNNTLLVVMGDHGPRFTATRRTSIGKLEERLPFLSIVLPKKLKQKRPNIEENLRKNIKVLTTPHDLYATIMDALDLRKYWNPYKIKGATLTRGVSLFEPIPSNRSCSEAGIRPHWCSCLEWEKLPRTHSLYKKAALSFVDYINQLTKEFRSHCVIRNLKSIVYVQKLKASGELVTTSGDDHIQNYQLKVTVSPGDSIYEASMEYDKGTGVFTFSPQDISKISSYGSEPSCKSFTHPHLDRSYCYCKNEESNSSINH